MRCIRNLDRRLSLGCVISIFASLPMLFDFVLFLPHFSPRVPFSNVLMDVACCARLF
ncbi:hypothetical protein BDZ91DRAFT_743063 [Kalaharituber pfeilii]|nr:hypothetical protein BDZ91DRAFT_743063 [Kalaharituber pfeilii]